MALVKFLVVDRTTIFTETNWLQRQIETYRDQLPHFCCKSLNWFLCVLTFAIREFPPRPILPIKSPPGEFLHVPFNFISLYLLLLIFAMKLRIYQLQSHWSNLVFPNQWLIQNSVKKDWFSFIFIVWAHFNHKTEKFRFRKSLKYFNIFW